RARNGEQTPGRTPPRALAVGADVLHHHLVEPGFHPGIRFAPLPVAAVMPLDAPRDPAEADLFAFPLAALLLGFRRHGQRDFLLVHPLEDGVTPRFWQLLPPR